MLKVLVLEVLKVLKVPVLEVLKVLKVALLEVLKVLKVALLEVLKVLKVALLEVQTLRDEDLGGSETSSTAGWRWSLERRARPSRRPPLP